ncbi:MAG TPA: hypothetical protein VKU83_12365, partial [Puia sp.]|nr:hypothetical protein [Puia sp.]
MKRSIVRWLRDVSIAKKLYFTVGIMALLIAIELGVLMFSINTLSSVRAYVGGEGLWSKAQKDGLYQLFEYARTRDEADYRKFEAFMKVNLGDHKARIELSKGAGADLNIVRQGFIEGRNNPDDVDGMIKLFLRFHGNRYISRAIMAWTSADSVIADFITLGKKLQEEVQTQPFSQQRV